MSSAKSEPDGLPLKLGVRSAFQEGVVYNDVLVVGRYRPVYVLLGNEGTFTVPKAEADRLGLPMREGSDG